MPTPDYCCEQRAQFVDTRMVVIAYQTPRGVRTGYFGLFDNGNSFVATIDYCPWCGEKLDVEADPAAHQAEGMTALDQAGHPWYW